MKNPYLKGTLGMYLNFFILGMVNIIFSSNMGSLMQQLSTDAAGISFLLSAFGIGKLLTYAVNGYLSDKFGRKPLVAAASILTTVFLLGFPSAPSYSIAFVLSVLMGIGNSAMDSGTYPALTESYPKSAGTANVLAKVFNSFGAILLPILITTLASNNLGYQFSFYIPAIVTVIALALILSSSFPNHKKSATDQEDETTKETNLFTSKPKFWIEGLALIVIGFTALGLLMVAPLWLPTLAKETLNMTDAQAVSMLSFYSTGSFVSVILLVFALKKISSLFVMILYPLITIVSYFVLLNTSSISVAIVASFFVGLSISGVLQLAITAITQLFPENKGTMTGIISTSGSIATITMPALSGMMINSVGIVPVIWLQIGLAIIGAIAAIIVKIRYKQLTSNTFKEAEAL